ncbi:hypothetical protein FF38_10653 [Lucilia cuprina]|uniref:Uncharacterized protein n=1 Tax=Lucilia cuprina TaxID=7375 RepID=A0A0L0CPJ0_LUCCU|nr:hypothetical protein FF38_10653 [Lucilia cuprina]
MMIGSRILFKTRKLCRCTTPFSINQMSTELSVNILDWSAMWRVFTLGGTIGIRRSCITEEWIHEWVAPVSSSISRDIGKGFLFKDPSPLLLSTDLLGCFRSTSAAVNCHHPTLPTVPAK